MKSQNLVVAGVSLAARLGAIGAGALLSSNAMAASTDSVPATATITMVSIGDGSTKPFSCTITGVTLPEVLIGTGAPGQSITVSGSGDVAFGATGAPVPAEGGVIVNAQDNPGMLVSGTGEIGGTTISAGTLSVVATGSAGAPPMDLSTAVNVDSVPRGTPEQCAAIQQTMTTPDVGGATGSSGSTVPGKP